MLPPTPLLKVVIPLLIGVNGFFSSYFVRFMYGNEKLTSDQVKKIILSLLLLAFSCASNLNKKRGFPKWLPSF